MFLHKIYQNAKKICARNVPFRRLRRITRFVALVTLVSLVSQDFAFAQGGTPLAVGREKSFQNNFLNLPREYGEKRYSKIFNGKDFVINIQDAHESLGAQKSIAKVLESLAKDYDLGLVGIEGSTG